VAAIGEVRRARLGLLEMEALPLLRGIADGSLDPSDHTVRDQCARHAATLRRALVDRAAPTKLDLYHRAVEDGHLPSPP
jgi:hypothetical protein